MIKGKIEDIKDIAFLDDEVKVEILLKIALLNELQCGVYEMKGENKVIVSEFESEADDGVFEAHKKFLDIHIGISGNEIVAWGNIADAIPVTEYESVDDYMLFSLNNRRQTCLDKGEFILFLPEDVHKCGLANDKNSYIRKAIFKIKI